MWNLYVELREPESFCGTFLWNLGTFICGTWELVREEPLCGTLGYLVPGFGRLPQTTTKLYWKNPKLFKLLGKNVKKSQQPNYTLSLTAGTSFSSTFCRQLLLLGLASESSSSYYHLAFVSKHLKSFHWNLQLLLEHAGNPLLEPFHWSYRNHRSKHLGSIDNLWFKWLLLEERSHWYEIWNQPFRKAITKLSAMPQA